MVFKCQPLKGVVNSNTLAIAKDIIIPEKEKYKPPILHSPQYGMKI